MLSLNEQEKDVFLKLARSQDAEIIKGYIEKVMKETSDVENLTSDIIQNAKTVKHILQTNLLDILDEKIVEPHKEDSYE